MNEDTAIEFQPEENNDVDTESPSDEKDVSRSGQVFDISEDAISPIKEEDEGASSGTMKVFPIRRPVTAPFVKTAPIITSTPPPAPASFVKAPVPPPAPVTPPKIETPVVPTPPISKTEAPATTTVTPEPTKNILDPNYVPPNEFATQGIATVRPKIIIPDSLPEIPAFKGTLDQKPHSFTPLSTNKPAEPAKPARAPYVPSYTPPVAKPTPAPAPAPIAPKQEVPKQETAPVAPQPIPAPAPIPVAANIPKPPAFSVKAVEPIPAPTSPTKSIGSIPLKDISGQFAPNRSVPGNQAAKTLGATPAPRTDGKIQPGEESDLQRLRTYESDVANALSHKHTSVASIAIAENTKKEEAANTQIQTPENESPQQQSRSAPKTHSVFKVLLVILIILFIGGGIGGAYYLYSKSPLAPSPQTTIPEPITNTSGVVTINTEAIIDIRGLDLTSVRARIATEVEKSHSPGNIHELIFVNDGTPVTEVEMLTLMQIDAPDILKRSLTNPWMFGIYTNERGEKDVFVAATTNFFQNTFAGMLQWENIMADDLKLYISSARGIVNAPPASSPISVSSTTSGIPTPVQPATSSIDPYFTLRGQFEDRIIMNKDVRVFRTTDRNILFLYSFINNSTLVFTTKEQTLVEILNRLEKQAFLR
jgi:hypothetical protein